MVKFDINIVILTYRSDFIAKSNLKIALETIKHYNNARLIIGYGGDDVTHRDWLTNFKISVDNNSSLELFSEISPSKRMKWALDFPSEWIIFISDDDPITSNYLSALIDEIANSDESIGNIFPKYYGLNNASNVRYISLSEIIESKPYDRIYSFLNSDNPGVRYYSAHRAGSIKNIIEEKFNSNFFPSYLDQLITLSSIISGKSISCRQPNIMVYDLDNWANDESSIISDSKFYENKTTVFFHEILWLCDYINILHSHLNEQYQYEWIASYCLKRLNDTLGLFVPRLKLIPIDKFQSKSILDTIDQLYSSIITCKNIGELKLEINKSRDTVFSLVNPN